MRVIAGQARGRRLRAPDTRDTRPATDMVREAVFSSLGAFVVDASVADLYAGSGSYGLEALSRGAADAVFVEKGRRALQALRANVAVVGLGGIVIEGDVAKFLDRPSTGYDLVFIDPPWDLASPRLGDQLLLVDNHLRDGGVVVLSRRAADDPPATPETWVVATDKRYGDTRILKYEKLKART